MQPHEAYPGATVRIGEGTRKVEFRGMGGIIERSFGSPDYPALDVRLENGRRELFWFHQLDSVEAPCGATVRQEDLVGVKKPR
jgi:hypothetical protein